MFAHLAAADHGPLRSGFHLASSTADDITKHYRNSPGDRKADTDVGLEAKALVMACAGLKKKME
jgi:hypothetical protein